MATQNKSTSQKSKKPAQARSGQSKKPPSQSQKVARRQLVGAGLFFVAFLLCLSLFNFEGFVLKFINEFFRGLIGIGFYILPFAMAISAYALVFKSKKKKIYVFITLIMLLPLLLGAFGHVFLTFKNPVPFNNIAKLYQTGATGASGGVFSGFLAGMFGAAISNIGAGVLLLILTILDFSLAFSMDFASLSQKLVAPPKNSPQVHPDMEDDSPVMPLFTKLRKIDIPLDDPKSATKVEKPAEKPPEKPITLDQPPPPVEKEKVPFLPWAKKEEKETLLPPPTVKPPAEAIRDNSIFGSPKSHEPIIVRTPPVETFPEPAVAVSFDEEIAEEIDANLKLQSGIDPDAYVYPPMTLLKLSPPVEGDPEHDSRMLADRLVDTLLSFGIDSTVVGITRGPSVTRYELSLQRGTKISRVVSLADDIALALGAMGVRISTVPDKLAVGVEVPNLLQQMVTIRDILDTPEFRNHKSKLAFPVGKDIANSSIVGDIAKMPHMLIAGTTGSGKSVCVNSILISLLYKASPDEVRLVMIDPKMIELGVYNGIPHLLIPVVTDPKKASGALNWAVSEMMRRYKLLSELGVRDLASYNAEVKARGEGETMPQIVIVIDELADLMVTAAREVEESITRIAQMARAAGMHLIIATQRPSADVITGTMKTNIPSRIAFAVASSIDSRIILDTTGAEKLIGKGDMLYGPLGVTKPMRVQGCFISTAEVESVVDFVKKTGKPDYSNEIMEHIEANAAGEKGSKSQGGGDIGGDDSDDPMMNSAIEIVVETGQASVSMLQRRLKLGYSRAARLVDQMEDRGIVGPFEGSKPRAVLISREEWQEMVLRSKI